MKIKRLVISVILILAIALFGMVTAVSIHAHVWGNVITCGPAGFVCCFILALYIKKEL